MKKIYLFLLLMVGINLYGQTLRDGTYYIKLYINQSYVITAFGPAASGNDIMIWQNEGNDNQKWILRNNSDGTITLYTVMDDNYAIDLSSSVLERGRKIQLWEDNNGNAQRWRLKNHGSYYTLVSAYSDDWAIDLNNCIVEKGNNIWLWDVNGGNAQKWVFTPVNSNQNVNAPSNSQNDARVRNVQPVQVWVPCDVCGGSGRCKWCNGTGTYWYWVGDDHRSMQCAYCNGSGICPICHGTRGQYRTEYVTQ